MKQLGHAGRFVGRGALQDGHALAEGFASLLSYRLKTRVGFGHRRIVGRALSTRERLCGTLVAAVCLRRAVVHALRAVVVAVKRNIVQRVTSVTLIRLL